MTTFQKIIKYCAIAFALFLTVSIITGIVGAVSGVTYLFSGRTAAGEMKTYTIGDPVRNLEIELGGAELEIRTGEKFQVESDHKYLKLENSEGSLRIHEDRPAFGSNPGGVRVRLTVPEEHVFEKADISAGAGMMKIDVLQADTLSLDLGAGEASIGMLAANANARINGGAGELTIRDGKLANLNFDMGIGEADLTCELTGNCEIDYGVGELNLTLAGTADDYRIILDKGLGEAMLNNEAMSDGTVYGNGENSIDIDGGVGDLRIRFRD